MIMYFNLSTWLWVLLGLNYTEKLETCPSYNSVEALTRCEENCAADTIHPPYNGGQSVNKGVMKIENNCSPRERYRIDQILKRRLDYLDLPPASVYYQLLNQDTTENEESLLEYFNIEIFAVCVPKLYLSKSRFDDFLVAVLKEGELVEVLEEQGRYRKLRSLRTGVEGWAIEFCFDE